jgi:hypothetical protein
MKMDLTDDSTNESPFLANPLNRERYRYKDEDQYRMDWPLSTHAEMLQIIRSINCGGKKNGKRKNQY